MQAGLEVFREAFLDALLTGDERAAELVAREAIEGGLPETEICEEVITPALHTVGEMWAGGLISVADEHLATQISMRVLALQRDAFRRLNERTNQQVYLAGIEGEQHVVGLEMAANLLRHSGFDVRYLGPDVPVQSLAQIVGRRRPHVVALTVTMRDSAMLIDLALEEVGRASPGTGFVIGGSGVPATLIQTDRIAVSQTLTDVVDKVTWLIARPSLN
jgi:MerR family transcriptional regulator, light-induced transcriptional regulator